MEYAVSREGTTLVTLHEGTDTTACSAAAEKLSEQLAALESSVSVEEWSVIETDVYEHPAAPFDPYTVVATFRMTIAVDADTESEAAERGAVTIDRMLEAGPLESITYTGEAAVSAV
ncbi:hypothetical protein OB919_11980 [Halobacteria archaeon AArc-curdl1]|uniref:Uncharacterized protein n=1 Tax=Natronosalvus hydrolyticus TaxID=2979988 RepID=A0AAP2Z8J3_9EURY|nr:hypothetical protein [Halobacteria archaeon AArc-curdl1]